MATQPVTYKKVFGDYEISTTDVDGSTESQIVLRTEQVRIYGDLIVTGNQSVVSETSLAISDNEILLNEGEGGAGVTLGTANVTVDRGSLANTGLRWNESTDKWQLTNDGTNWYDILSAGGGGISAVVEDTSPQLGGDLDINGQSIVSVSAGDIVFEADTTGMIVFENGDLVLKRRATDPTARADYNILYHKTEGSGGTGLYFRTTSTGPDELISKTKAIVYSIIF
jgi:hypothetical protein